MKAKMKLVTSSFLVIGVLAMIPAAFAEDASQTQPPAAAPAAPAVAAPASSPEMDAMMAKWKEASTPGVGHAALEPLVGTWDSTVKWWKDPASAPEESKGTSVVQWTFGGRFLEQKFSGTSMGQPFEGLGITGFDNIAKKYQSIWIDNMSTSMMVGSGTYDAAAKSLTDSGTFSCPMTGGERTYRSVLKILSDQSYSYEMFMNDPKTSQEYRGMEIVYTKKV